MFPQLILRGNVWADTDEFRVISSREIIERSIGRRLPVMLVVVWDFYLLLFVLGLAQKAEPAPRRLWSLTDALFTTISLCETKSLGGCRYPSRATEKISNPNQDNTTVRAESQLLRKSKKLLGVLKHHLLSFRLTVGCEPSHIVANFGFGSDQALFFHFQ